MAIIAATASTGRAGNRPRALAVTNVNHASKLASKSSTTRCLINGDRNRIGFHMKANDDHSRLEEWKPTFCSGVFRILCLDSIDKTCPDDAEALRGGCQVKRKKRRQPKLAESNMRRRLAWQKQCTFEAQADK